MLFGNPWKSVPRAALFSEALLAKGQFLGAHVLLEKPRWRLTSPIMKSIFSIPEAPPKFLWLSSVKSCRIVTSFTWNFIIVICFFFSFSLPRADQSQSILPPAHSFPASVLAPSQPSLRGLIPVGTICVTTQGPGESHSFPVFSCLQNTFSPETPAG